ncbi:MAG: hypothetical protein M1395_07955 [Bacteroidetes bacterium]|nr:hypothetical protein [Bacteroidota bacterium]
MNRRTLHTFHIPVLGLAFSIDTPLKVARFGISSVISVVDDVLIEQMRKYHSQLNGESYVPISVREDDYRARRITAYLNMVGRLVERQTTALRLQPFEDGSEIVRFFEMLPDHSPAKSLYSKMLNTSDGNVRSSIESELRSLIVAGDIDVNIMTKVDRLRTGRQGGAIPSDSSDAVAAMRGFVRSDLNSSVVLSAGLNPRLFAYMEQCPEFLPGTDGVPQKKVILKVSDYRSARIQGKILAKKGIWCSEFRVESGLNCGGHAFATDGYLLGPILEEFNSNRASLAAELLDDYSAALRRRGAWLRETPMDFLLTVQGGIGTSAEDTFLREYYKVDGTGWGSPFLLVPEVTNVDAETRNLLAESPREAYYLSNASPLGVLFNNIRNTTSEKELRRRADEGKPGSPCTKKYLATNTEFTEEPICTASNRYQALKISELKKLKPPSQELDEEIDKIIEKACLCEGLSSTAPLGGNKAAKNRKRAVAICPGPNLAYFSRIASLEEMVGHIYGRMQLLTNAHRPNMFIQELRLYVDYLKNEIRKRIDSPKQNDLKYLQNFKATLQEGIEYYKSIIPSVIEEVGHYRETMLEELLKCQEELAGVLVTI